MTRKIGAVSVGRSDFGIYRPVLQQINDDPKLELQLIVTGAHLDTRCGHTVDSIRKEGWSIATTVPIPQEEDSAAGVGQIMGAITAGMADCLSALSPDLLLVLGDRYDMFAAASAAVPFGIPIAHIHGGEITEGAMDEQFRHAITKLSHLHFTSTRQYADRIIQMGESPWRVTVSGAPGLDNIHCIDWLSISELETQLEIKLVHPPVLITFHPETLCSVSSGKQIACLLDALKSVNHHPLIFSYPNADMGSDKIISALTRFVKSHPQAYLFKNLGTQRYFSLMKIAAAVVGNSSSGIIETGSFALPAVNIGDRQKGRTRGPNILDCSCETKSIEQTLEQALSRTFRNSIADMENPYGTGHASRIITERVSTVDLNDALLRKTFYDNTKNSKG